MRPLLLLALSFLMAALPAAAQNHLAQQCTGFGETQYRKLDPSVERICRHRISRPGAGALRREGGIAGRRRGADPARPADLSQSARPSRRSSSACSIQPIDRSSSMPCRCSPCARRPRRSRGAAPRAPPPPHHGADAPAGRGARAAEPPRAAVPAGAIQLRGLVRDIGGRLQFSPCDGAPLVLEDRTPGQELSHALRGLTQGQEGRAMFVEFHGRRETGPGLGVGALEVRRAAVETAGCRERFDQREWVAMGNEPSWRLDITAKDLLLNRAGRRSGTARGPWRPAARRRLDRLCHDGGGRVQGDDRRAALRGFIVWLAVCLSR